MNRSYLLISPGRNEAQYMRQTLDTVVAQSVRPTRWVIVDDGSTDDTPRILAEYAASHDWITVVTRHDRGHHARESRCMVVAAVDRPPAQVHR